MQTKKAADIKANHKANDFIWIGNTYVESETVNGEKESKLEKEI